MTQIEKDFEAFQAETGGMRENYTLVSQEALPGENDIHGMINGISLWVGALGYVNNQLVRAKSFERIAKWEIAQMNASLRTKLKNDDFRAMTAAKLDKYTREVEAWDAIGESLDQRIMFGKKLISKWEAELRNMGGV